MKIIYILIPFLLVYIVLVVIYFDEYYKRYYKEHFINDSVITNDKSLEEDDNIEMFEDSSVKKKAELNVTKDESSFNQQMSVYKDGLNDKYAKITDAIEDVYLPYSESSFENADTKQTKLNEFIIIDVYKNILNRQPKPNELNKHLQDFYEENMNEDILKMRLYNSTEYKMIVKMQSNDVDAGLVSTASSENMIDMLASMYKKELKRDPRPEMLLKLKDCYIHLQFNDYLFRAMLIHNKFGDFENEVMSTRLLSRDKMLDIFNKYFLLSELKLIANDFKRQDILNRKAKMTVEAMNTGNGANINTSNLLGAGKQISEIVKDGNNVFNINIMLNEDMMRSKPYSDDDSRKVYNGSGTCENVKQVGDKYRIYNPIKYQQQYRGDMRYRPNVCSYGPKQVVQPVFVESKTLFQGTSLKEAIENTSVGSIMPKFEYREYEEVPIKGNK